MAKRQSSIDSETPWTVTLRDWNYRLYTYKMSASEWRILLARAKKGDPEAEWEVADRYGDGCKNLSGKILVKRSRKKAAQWIRLSWLSVKWRSDVLR